MKDKKPERDPRNVPTAWFAVLEHARETGNPAREREAMENLKRLGVKVDFTTREVPNGK